MRYLIKTEVEVQKSIVEFTPATPAERENCLALKAAGKLKKPKTRKDKFVAPELRDEVAQKLVGFILRRVQFPRNGEPFFLSHTDKCDATQAGLLACVESGFFRHGIAGLRVLRAIRNAVQGRACLRMRCQRETGAADIALVAAEIGHSTEFEVFAPRLTKSQVEMSRELMRVLRASLACDTSRKKIQCFKTARDFFIHVMDSLTGKTHAANSKTGKRAAVCASSLRSRKLEFVTYLTIGENFLRATREPANLGAEIMQAMSDHARERALA